MSGSVASSSQPLHRHVGAALLRGAVLLWRCRWALAAMLLASLLPLLVRLLVLREHQFAWKGYDRNGAAADIGIGLAVTALLILAWRSSRIVFAAAAALWILLNVGYYEFIHQYSSPYFLIHVAYVFDPTFLEGSALSLTHPLLTAAAAVLFPALTIAAAQSRHRIPAGLVAVIGIAGIVFAYAQPISTNASDWRMRSFLQVNIADVVQRAIYPDDSAAVLADNADLVASYLKPDLSGTPIVSARRPYTNVVIVMIESISGAQIPSLAAAQGMQSGLAMPLLDGIARDNLSFSAFVAQQRQSNRGIYAAMCGDLPRLFAGLAKMTAVADGGRLTRKCLPEVLGEHGYDSVFLHAADGLFMLMKPFMRKIGFRRALGQEDFDPALPRYSWGIDDASLYRIALDEIDRLAARGKPFLLTTFSTSTHHPFEIPAGFADYPDLSPHERAWHFADRAVSDFVAALAARGRLDDTLVLVTSDEASPWPDMQGDRPAALADYAENWGYMIALTPERHRERVDAPFAQGDIPISVLDYLGFDTNGTDFMGRSFFRRYDTPRTIYAGNVYKRRAEELVTGGRLTVCGEALDACEAFDAAGGRVFGALQPLPGPTVPSRMMRAMRAYSATVPVEGPPEPALGG